MRYTLKSQLPFFIFYSTETHFHVTNSTTVVNRNSFFYVTCSSCNFFNCMLYMNIKCTCELTHTSEALCIVTYTLIRTRRSLWIDLNGMWWKKPLSCCLCQALKSNTIDSQFDTKACIGTSINRPNTATKPRTNRAHEEVSALSKTPERSEQTQTKSRWNV